MSSNLFITWHLAAMITLEISISRSRMQGALHNDEQTKANYMSLGQSI
jgi:hypothetical protein